MEEKIETYITELKENIKKRYDETCQNPGGKDNILRGHTRSLSTDVEDEIAVFISKILPDYRYFVDFSITANGKTYRPDLLILNKKKVVAMLEIKANMGYARKSQDKVIKQIRDKHEAFKNKELVNNHNDISNEFDYGEDVKLFLISLTSSNCGNQDTHEAYQKACSDKKISYFCLFDGWYSELKEKEKEKEKEKVKGITEFAEAMQNLSNSQTMP